MKNENAHVDVQLDEQDSDEIGMFGAETFAIASDCVKRYDWV